MIRVVGKVVMVQSLVAFVIMSQPVVCGAVDVLWDGGGDGTTWNDKQNWVGGNGPGDGDDRGILGDTTANRTVTIDAPDPDELLGWNQSTSGVVNKVQLNTDWTPSLCCIVDSNYTNTTGDPGALVLDLNGFRKEQLQGGTHFFPPMTIMSSQPGGELVYARKLEWAANEVIVGENVTIRSKLHGYNNTFDNANGDDPPLTWHPNSKLIIDGNDGVFTGTTHFGDVEVVNNGVWGNNGYFTIQGDLNIEVGSRINLLQGTPQRMNLQGNITDLNTTGDYTDGRLEFIGSGDVQEINIHRPLRSSINIKDGANVKLMHDLDASLNSAANPHESTWITGTVDLNGFDFSTNQLVVNQGMDIIWGAGTESSVIEVTDRLGNIGSFDVTITDLGGWQGSNDFVLFDYAGTKGVYGPSVGTVTLPTGWTHDGLVDTGNLGDANAPGQLILSNLTNNSVAPTPLFDFDWNQAGSGNWDTAGNWNPLGPPNGPNLSVGFLDAIEGPSTVTVDSAFTVNSIHFALTNHGYAIAGAGSVHLAASTGGSLPSINVTSSSHSFTANVVMQASATVDTATATEVAFVTLDLGGHTLTKSGAGRMTIRGVATGGSVDVQQGTLVGNEITGNLTNDGGMVSLGDDIGQLQVSGVLENTSLGTVLLKIAGSADVADSYDQIQVTGSAELAGTLEVITSATYSDPSVRGSRDDFILLSTTEGVTGVFETVNYDAAALTADFRNGDSFRSHQGNGLFRNVTYTGTQVRLTNLLALEGDADGDMDVDITDFNYLASNFDTSGENSSTNSWTSGDFDADRDIDITDFNYLASNFAVDGYGSSASTGQVPEPTAWCLLAMSGLLLLGKWRTGNV